MDDDRRLTFKDLRREAKNPEISNGKHEKLEEVCIRYLQARGYRVLGRSIATKIFPCGLGHNHKTSEAKEKCEHSQAAFTGMSVLQLAEMRKAESRPRYESAYKDFASGLRKTEIARSLGVTRGRADQIIKRGWRYALEDKWATKVP